MISRGNADSNLGDDIVFFNPKLREKKKTNFFPLISEQNLRKRIRNFDIPYLINNEKVKEELYIYIYIYIYIYKRRRRVFIKINSILIGQIKTT